jgi:hypothetical protein
MYYGSIETSRIIEAFQRYVPDTYVRDYRDNGGYIVICRGLKDIPWKDQTTTKRVYRQVPKVTLANLPRGFVTSATRYVGLKLDRPGWRREFRRSMRHLTTNQMRAITDFLGMGEVFPGIC